MRVDFAFLCDHAEVSGKINALGIGFDTIYARKVPVRHPYFFLVAQFRASIAEIGGEAVDRPAHRRGREGPDAGS